MKTCGQCGEEKSFDDFHKRSKAKDGRQSVCKACNNGNRAAYYKTTHGRAVDVANGKRSKQILRDRVIDFLLQRSCVDCGESDLVVLEFDHRNPEGKLFTINEAVQRGIAWSRILEEIEKCDVRCANCHRRRTAIQFGWTRAASSGGRAPLLQRGSQRFDSFAAYDAPGSGA